MNAYDDAVIEVTKVVRTVLVAVLMVLAVTALPVAQAHCTITEPHPITMPPSGCPTPLFDCFNSTAQMTIDFLDHTEDCI